MRLLSKQRLIRTSEVDHADWNYDPVLAYVMRRRFALIRKLLPARHVQRILEIGFGSGIFMPDLSSRCDELYGVDIHEHVADVKTRLASAGIRAELFKQDAAALTFPDAYFDLIVSVSALEFIGDIAGAAREAARVLKPGGSLIAVMPVKSALLDRILHALTGADPQKDYGDRRERVVPAVLRYFRVTEVARFGPIYRAYSFKRL